MTVAPVHGPAGRAWRCDGCGRTSLWTDDHEWYGSLRDLEDGHWGRVLVSCCLACHDLLIADGRVPADARYLDGPSVRRRTPDLRPRST